MLPLISVSGHANSLNLDQVAAHWAMGLPATIAKVEAQLHMSKAFSPEGKALSPQEIERINAHGPFHHGCWQGRGVSVTNEGPLRNRMAKLVGTLSQFLRTQFSAEEMANKSIADVGCDDGYLIEQLSQLPFRDVHGFEPRQDGIRRGEVVRDVLEIPSRVRYQGVSLDSIPNGLQFDVVLSTGLFHHLRSVPEGIVHLVNHCKELVIIECIVVPEHAVRAVDVKDVELKDIIYREKTLSGMFGVSFQKYESDYCPGSQFDSSVVEFASVNTFELALSQHGFHDFRVLLGESDYKNFLDRSYRNFESALMVARRGRSTSLPEQIENIIVGYEHAYVQQHLAKDLVARLWVLLEAGMAWNEVDTDVRVTFGVDKYEGAEAEMYRSLQYAPRDKLRLERAKIAIAESRLLDAKQELSTVTQTLNSDWRSCYRAFYLLAKVAQQEGDAAERSRQWDNCRNCNPKYPVVL